MSARSSHAGWGRSKDKTQFEDSDACLLCSLNLGPPVSSGPWILGENFLDQSIGGKVTLPSPGEQLLREESSRQT